MFTALRRQRISFVFSTSFLLLSFWGLHIIKGYVIQVVSTLPKNPDDLLFDGWEETTHPVQTIHSNSREFTDRASGLTIRYDKKQEGAPGFRGINHYHIHNPNSTTGKKDYHLDVDGNPVPKNSTAPQIIPKKRR